MSPISGMASGEREIPFPRLWNKALALSAALVLISLLSLVVLRFDLGIDFKGGTSWEVRAPGVSVAQARDVLRPLGEADARIQIVDGEVLRIQSTENDPARAQEIAAELSSLGAIEGFQSVGPTWGDEITKKAIRALVVFFVLLAAFMSWRLEWKMAIAGLVAVVHDIAIAAGVYAIFQISVTPATVVAFLTILGYSLYDTIVVFDKVHELSARPAVANRFTYTDTMNLALNQVIMRSINTTVTSAIPVATLLVVGRIQGTDTLFEFGVALLVGLIVGAYSSLFVAAPLVVRLKEREPRYRATRERLARGGDRVVVKPEARPLAGVNAAATGGETVPAATGTRSSAPSARPAGPIPPRPRKKKRR
jgi:preprotein translocase subunit SecF